MTHYIDIEDMAYSPSEITIKVGDSIVWRNKDGMGHTATRKDSPVFDTGLIRGGTDSVAIQFSQTSSDVIYFCKPHKFMEGKITIIE